MPKADFIMKMINKCKGFDALTKNVKYLSADNGNCQATLKVEPEHTNPIGGLHGGFSATLVDIVSSMALVTHKYGEVPSVSVDMHMSYLKSATVGDELLINAKTLRVGKTLAFLEVEILNNATKDLLVKGSHTKFLLKPK